MSISQLEYFVSVARHLSFTKAAKECCVVQSAITQQIKALEEELGFALFDRTKRKVALTPAGERYYRDTVALLEQLRKNNGHAWAIANGKSGKLCVGVAGANQSVYMDALRAFHTQNPAVELQFARVTTANQYSELCDGAYDTIFTATFNLVAKEDIAFADVKESQLCVYMNELHPLALQSDVSLQDAAAYTNIFAGVDRSALSSDTLASLYTLNGIHPESILYVEDQNISSFLLSFNMGIAIAPVELIQSMPAGILQRPLAQGAFSIEMGWAYHIHNANPTLRRFLEHLNHSKR